MSLVFPSLRTWFYQWLTELSWNSEATITHSLIWSRAEDSFMLKVTQTTSRVSPRARTSSRLANLTFRKMWISVAIWNQLLLSTKTTWKMFSHAFTVSWEKCLSELRVTSYQISSQLDWARSSMSRTMDATLYLNSSRNSWYHTMRLRSFTSASRMQTSSS